MVLSFLGWGCNEAAFADQSSLFYFIPFLGLFSLDYLVFQIEQSPSPLCFGEPTEATPTGGGQAGETEQSFSVLSVCSC